VIFLLTVLLFVRVRRPREESVRGNLYAVLQDLEEVVDQDLSQEEFDRIHRRLEMGDSPRIPARTAGTWRITCKRFHEPRYLDPRRRPEYLGARLSSFQALRTGVG
jgi:hypothetical protein